ncbi:hypothetical protein LshimejAT787_0210810 [Lyophyllum shimeji]|uniref:F-box domain-containing protein n=1 Tax=Lyophyllum shimeji TaxID=47721 RepID=A0A9P3ULL8_LYOSH|nr:hypothetical protein LshimejAT787_0210810 [Lyophyllum shimeji]
MTFLDQSQQPRSLSIPGRLELPPELHDRIIDHLHADRSTLMACSTVCRAWLRAARHHFLSTLEIRRRNALTLRRLLKAPHATLGLSVRRLAIRAGKAVRPNQFIGDRLPVVESLLLSATYLVPVKELITYTRCYVHQLVELVLYSVKLDSFADFATELLEFKVLRHLCLANGVTWVDPSLSSMEADTEPSAAALPSLNSLILGGRNIDLAWWLLERKVVSIARLDLRPSHSLLRVASDAAQRSPEVNQIYRALGPNLYELDLRDDQQTIADLSANVKLRALWFHDVVLSDGQWVIDTLAQVVSPHLHTITLHAYSDDHGERVSLESFHWYALTQVLSNAPFSAQLRRIQILWLGFYDDAELTTGVRKRLVGHVPAAVDVVADFVSETETRFGATTHDRLFDRHYTV